jgi:sarcosine oxidase subunit alpha
VIGAGPAGLAAAAQAGAQALLIDRDRRPGGAALLKVDPGLPDPDRIAELARGCAGAVLSEAECVGLYANDSRLPGEALLAVRRGGRLLLISAERVIVATGGVSQPLPFPGVDRPGVYAARGLLALHEQCNVRVGRMLALTGDGAELTNCAAALGRAGYEVTVLREPVRRALGNPVRAVQLANERVRCDALAIALPPAPLHELATSVGAQARWSDAQHGFPVEADADGRTAVPWLFVAGRIAGRGGAQAVPSGQAAGKAAAR